MHLEKAIPLFFWLCLFSWFWQSKILQSGSKAPINQWMRACSKPIRTWNAHATTILAEGAIALPVTLSGGVLFASWKLLQFPSSLIVKVILAIFMRASAQRPSEGSKTECTHARSQDKCNASRRLYLHRITSTVISWAYSWHSRPTISTMMMTLCIAW